MNQELKAVIVHLSDTHFNRSFQNEKATFLSRLGASPHDFKLLKALDTAFSEIPFQLQKSLKLENKPKIDMVFVTGDLTTDGEKNSFGNAQTFFTTKYMTGITKGVGLNMKQKIYIVPGNHDCLYQKFEKVPFLRYFFTKYHRYYSRQFPKLPCFRKRKVNDKHFLLVGIDTNKVKKRPRYVAKGRVGSTQLEKIEKYLESEKNKDAEYFKNSFKIAYLHHHLIAQRKEKFSFLKQAFGLFFKHFLLPHSLEDDREVCETLSKYKFDMVIFGHKHKSYQEFWNGDDGNMIMSCAGSVSQLDKRYRNSFKIYLIFSDRIQIVEYIIKKDSIRYVHMQPLRPPFPIPNPL